MGNWIGGGDQVFRTEEVTYFFIDGRYLRSEYEEKVLKWFGSTGQLDFERVVGRFCPSPKRSYYYDALEDEPKIDGEPKEQVHARTQKQEAEFSKIQENAGCILRLGSVSGMKRNRRQKKVDIFLTLDMMNHAMRKNMTKAVLLAGDRDFEPVVKEVADMGITVEVVADRSSRHVELTNAADKFRAITFEDYWSCSSFELQRQFPIPIPVNDIRSAWTPVRTGIIGQDPCRLFNPPGQNFWCFTILAPMGGIRCSYGVGEPERTESLSKETLDLFLKLQYPEIKWD